MAIKTRNKVSADFSMSSMTDIVFLLLIFFMLTSTLVTTNAIDLLLPNAKKPKADNSPNVSVSIDQNLNFYVDRDPVEKAFLESALMNRLADMENKTVVLRVEKSVPIENAVYVMDIANQNRIKVVLATKPQK